MELVFFLCIYITWSRTVWVTVISLSCYFIFVQFIPYLTTVFNFAFVVFPPRATRVNAIKKWLLYRGTGVSTAVLGRSHIVVGNTTLSTKPKQDWKEKTSFGKHGLLLIHCFIPFQKAWTDIHSQNKHNIVSGRSLQKLHRLSDVIPILNK